MPDGGWLDEPAGEGYYWLTLPHRVLPFLVWVDRSGKWRQIWFAHVKDESDQVFRVSAAPGGRWWKLEQLASPLRGQG